MILILLFVLLLKVIFLSLSCFGCLLVKYDDRCVYLIILSFDDVYVFYI